ncbi:MAG: type III secretion system needle filament subunit SctF [Vibrio sp.]|uniref:type III secretion system needle filament subunit SctF n=1 Tax=Vibrio TaxID=662 RepID=UPI00140A9A55|nr:MULTISPECIES: type III secretion system needle filament subunit SctF [unclassified Vibrio]QIL85656.1 type III secretion system needle filament subunit SctF [Vibrio sp. HDW18]
MSISTFSITTNFATTPSELPGDHGTLHDVVLGYDQELVNLQEALDKALADISANPSDPGALARFQAAQADYTTFKQFVSNLVKSYRDLDQSIVRNIG